MPLSPIGGTPEGANLPADPRLDAASGLADAGNPPEPAIEEPGKSAALLDLPAVWKKAAGKGASTASDASPGAASGQKTAPHATAQTGGADGAGAALAKAVQAQPSSAPVQQLAASPLQPAILGEPSRQSGIIVTDGQAAASIGAGNGSASQASQVSQAAPARMAAPGQAPTVQVAIHMARAIQDGQNRISIRLDPPELGRVDVKLDVASDGRVIAVVAADRQETLDLLQRDARSLERALQDAGLNADGGSLRFSLRQHDQGADPRLAQGRAAADEADGLKPEADATPPTIIASRPASSRALDISI